GAMTGRGTWLARGGRTAAAGSGTAGAGCGGARCDGAGRGGVGRGGVLRGGVLRGSAGRGGLGGAPGRGLAVGLGAGVGTVLIGLALPLPPAFPALAVPGGLALFAILGGHTVGPRPVLMLVLHPVQGDQQAAPVAALTGLGERLKQPGADPLAG